MNYLVKRLSVCCLLTIALAACQKENSIPTTHVTPPATPPTEPQKPPAPPPPTNLFNDVVETKTIENKAITVNVNGNIGGYLAALPALYDSTTKNYPLILFLHGVGELGNGSTQLSNVAACGTPNVIKWKNFPANFVSNGKNFSFIVITPQFKSWPSAGDANDMLSYAIAHYRIDTTRVYVAGLSMGGGVTWEVDAAFGKRIAATVPICGASGLDNTKAQQIANAKLPVWAFHNQDDPTVAVSNSVNNVNKINSYGPNPAAKLTLWPSGGHDAWTKATDPSYKENNMNIYEWMLQYTR